MIYKEDADRDTDGMLIKLPDYRDGK